MHKLVSPRPAAGRGWWRPEFYGTGNAEQQDKRVHQTKCVKRSMRAFTQPPPASPAWRRMRGGIIICALPLICASTADVGLLDSRIGFLRSESGTPRTDAAMARINMQTVVSADFARQLERELAEARERADANEKDAERYRSMFDSDGLMDTFYEITGRPKVEADSWIDDLNAQRGETT